MHNVRRKTARQYYFAANFLQCMEVFDGPKDPEVIKFRKYALAKSSSITKAIRAGVQPTPGPPGGEAVSAYSLYTHKH